MHQNTHQNAQKSPASLNKLRAEAASLPPPDAEAMAHSQRLIELIRRAMAADGGRTRPLPFEKYMELALTAPGLGYYSAGSRKFGGQGDFVTAPEISPLFSRCVARQCAQVLQELKHQPGPLSVLEFGAGTGVMAAAILAELARLETLPEMYFILEPSADLKARQHETLEQQVPHLAGRVIWLDRLPDDGIHGVILANEVLDALPVHRIRIEGSHYREYYVDWQEDRFHWQLGPLTDPVLQPRAEAIQAMAGDHYTTEVNLAMDAWIHSLAGLLKAGLMLLIDYGFPRREYYHPQRQNGTLMCHYRHRSHDDPFVYPGLQDITAHVDFTAVAEAAVESGLDVAGYCAQAWFLLSCGLPEMVAATDQADQVRHMAATQQVKTLTSPEEMGELFKVIALSKSLDLPLLGFSLRDQREKL